MKQWMLLLVVIAYAMPAHAFRGRIAGSPTGRVRETAVREAYSRPITKAALERMATDKASRDFLAGERTPEALEAGNRLYTRLYSERGPGQEDYSSTLKDIVLTLEQRVTKDPLFSQGIDAKALSAAISAEREMHSLQVSSPQARVAMLRLSENFASGAKYLESAHLEAMKNVKALEDRINTERGRGDATSKSVADTMQKIIALAAVNPQALKDIPELLTQMETPAGRSQSMARMGGVLSILQYHDAANKSGEGYKEAVDSLVRHVTAGKGPEAEAALRKEIAEQDKIVEGNGKPDQKGTTVDQVNQGFTVAEIGGPLKAKLMKKAGGGRVESVEELLANIDAEIAAEKAGGNNKDKLDKLSALRDYFTAIRLVRFFNTLERFKSWGAEKKVTAVKCAFAMCGLMSVAATKGAQAALMAILGAGSAAVVSNLRIPPSILTKTDTMTGPGVPSGRVNDNHKVGTTSGTTGKP